MATLQPHLAKRVQHRMHHRFSWLLAAEFALIVGSPLLQSAGLNPGQYGLLGFAVFTAALYTVIGEGRLTAVAFVLGGAAIAFNISASFAGVGVASLPGLVFGALFMGFVTAVILRSVVTSTRVTIETLYGAVAAYVLLGITWGGVYFLVETIAPASFRSSIAPAAPVVWPDCLFFSFVTLTTIGYGDIVPIGNMAKSLVVLEAVTGIMYPAVMIGRLIAMHSALWRER